MRKTLTLLERVGKKLITSGANVLKILTLLKSLLERRLLLRTQLLKHGLDEVHIGFFGGKIFPTLRFERLHALIHLFHLCRDDSVILAETASCEILERQPPFPTPFVEQNI